MVRLERVRKSYGRGPDAIRAADEVTLAVRPGEFVVITGPSGSGKTTLLNLIGGMTRPDAGTILVAGHDLASLSDAALSLLRGQSIGFVFQFSSMLPTLTALENTRLPLMLQGLDDETAGRALLDKVGLGGREHAYAHELSAGQQRRVGLARALDAGPKLLLCDEPTGDLDPETEAAIMDLLVAANHNGATVVMTTHNQGLRAYGSRALNISMGRVQDV
ncbi:MAG TPA: ABC transporter ATP-binding protein [bacterium]|nr:ABC transporter ATP-binding protein [bacterium]